MLFIIWLKSFLNLISFRIFYILALTEVTFLTDQFVSEGGTYSSQSKGINFPPYVWEFTLCEAKFIKFSLPFPNRSFLFALPSLRVPVYGLTIG